MEQDSAYHAFISYSHKDEAFAKRLQHYLEHYKMPSVLCRKYPHIPRNLRPIFRDGSDLAIGQLSETLREALSSSRYLLVICSENSVRPNADGKNWIDEEIRMFIDMHHESEGIRRVIPIIYRKTDAVSIADCLLPAIRELDILAADVFAMGEARAFNDVAAKMAGLKPDMLWNRYLREQRRMRLLRHLGGVAAVALAAAAGWFCWDYYVPHVSYYTDYVERDNVPEGLFKLTEEQMQQRRRHYRFTTHQFHLRTVEYCNSAGTLQPHEDFWNFERPAKMELRYSEKGRVTGCIQSNAQGKRITSRKFGPSCIDFGRMYVKDGTAVSAAKPATLATDMSKKGTARHSISRFYVHREKGLVLREHFSQANGFGIVPMKDTQGIGGRLYKRDELGRPYEVGYLAMGTLFDSGATMMETCCGVAGYRLTYGENGQITNVTYLNKRNEPTLNEEQWAELRIHYNEHGNAEVFSYFGTDGEPCILPNGYTHKVWHYDERGNLTSAAFYGKDGKPCIHRNGYQRKTWQYDERGNVIQADFYDADGNPCLHKGGYLRKTWQYDERGNVIQENFYGADGKLCLYKGGYSSCRWEYHYIRDNKNDKINKIEMSYLDAEGNPCTNKDGHARIKWLYDEHGNQMEQSYHGITGELCLNMNNDNRISGQYDERGAIIIETNLGIEPPPLLRLNKDKQPELSAHPDSNRAPVGHARVTFKYDERGNRTEQAYFDTDGKPCLHRDGYSRVTAEYDVSGNKKEQRYFGTDGKPCLHKDGYSHIIWRYDERGNVEEQAYLDADGRPCLHKDGYARIEWRHDRRGNRIQTCFGADGKPCLNKDGYAHTIWSYDSRGNVVEQAFYDTDGKQPAATPDGISRETWRHDEHGNIIGYRACDISGNVLTTP